MNGCGKEIQAVYRCHLRDDDEDDDDICLSFSAMTAAVDRDLGQQSLSDGRDELALERERVAGDGNCLYRSLALGMWRSEARHKQVRREAMDDLCREVFGDAVDSNELHRIWFEKRPLPPPPNWKAERSSLLAIWLETTAMGEDKFDDETRMARLVEYILESTRDGVYGDHRLISEAFARRNQTRVRMWRHIPARRAFDFELDVDHRPDDADTGRVVDVLATHMHFDSLRPRLARRPYAVSQPMQWDDITTEPPLLHNPPLPVVFQQPQTTAPLTMTGACLRRALQNETMLWTGALLSTQLAPALAEPGRFALYRVVIDDINPSTAPNRHRQIGVFEEEAASGGGGGGVVVLSLAVSELSSEFYYRVASTTPEMRLRLRDVDFLPDTDNKRHTLLSEPYADAAFYLWQRRRGAKPLMFAGNGPAASAVCIERRITIFIVSAVEQLLITVVPPRLMDVGGSSGIELSRQRLTAMGYVFQRGF